MILNNNMISPEFIPSWILHQYQAPMMEYRSEYPMLPLPQQGGWDEQPPSSYTMQQYPPLMMPGGNAYDANVPYLMGPQVYMYDAALEDTTIYYPPPPPPFEMMAPAPMYMNNMPPQQLMATMPPPFYNQIPYFE